MSRNDGQGVFLLVHGAFHGGWCWRDVDRVLTAHGHRVFRPSLTGLGDRKHLLDGNVNLATHIADIVNLAEAEDLHDIVLAGHSYAGFVITGAGDRLGDRIRSLVYVDAFVPDDGMAMEDYWNADIRKDWDDACAPFDGISRPPLPAKFFGLSGPQAEWVDAKCSAHPYATMKEKLRLTGGLDRIANKVFLRAERFPSANLDRFYDTARDDPGWRTHSLSCGHEVMVEMPERLAEILEGCR